MAIDSKSKRMSALLEGLVLPSGTIDAAERAATAWLYNGNTFPEVVVTGQRRGIRNFGFSMRSSWRR
ncbi:MAG: hypothetical protein ACXABY_11340 [Candidatus Thorarchaeota archaeon]